MAVKACMYCASKRIERNAYFEGPVVYTHDPMGMITCKACGKEGMAILFDTEEERAEFERELTGLE